MKTWGPNPIRAEQANVTRFAREVLPQPSPDDPSALYGALNSWSVEHPDDFWKAVWDWFEVIHEGEVGPVRSGDFLRPRWFAGTRLSLTEHFLRHRQPGHIALWSAGETRSPQAWTWDRLLERAAGIQRGLVERGVGVGDRVAVVLPNVADTVAAFIAVTGLGAVWVAASPEFGTDAILDRFGQVDPSLIIGCDGYTYGGRSFGTAPRLHTVAEQLGKELVTFGNLSESGWPSDFAELAGRIPETRRVPFEHPLWIVFTSGTTGKPKPLVHSHGGILLEFLKHGHFHLDLGTEDTFLWYTTTGWIMWNIVVGGLLTGSRIVTYDGSPLHPGPDRLWQIAHETGVTNFGSNPGFLRASQDAGVVVRRDGRLESLRAIGSTGSPLLPEQYDWVYEQLPEDIWLYSTSGGTEVASALMCGVPSLPVTRGEIQCRALGVDAQAWSESGEPLIDQVGELVVATPLPSMPVFMWDDPEGERLHDTYFARFPGVWTHGDWVTITSRGTAIIWGRSDATINRGGVRIGTSEIYSAVLSVPGIADVLAVDVHPPGTNGRLVLFVCMEPGQKLDEAVEEEVKQQLRSRISPRHIPDEIVEAPELPRTLSGKLLEIPIKRILEGAPAEKVLKLGSLRNPEALAYFEALARRDTSA